MIYVSKLTKERDGTGYPFTVPAIAALDELEFTADVTMLTGGNGSGKSTLLELIADRLGAERIGTGAVERRNSVKSVGRSFKLARRRVPKRSFMFTAEDFSAYITWVSRSKDEARAEIKRINNDPTVGDKAYASMPHYHTLGDLEALYASDLSARSHGEGFIDFFAARLKPEGVYLLDEPEGALSYENQYVLALMIRDAVREKACQFILATHSPILTALPEARLIELTDAGFRDVRYEELEGVEFLRLFMNRYKQMLKIDQ